MKVHVKRCRERPEVAAEAQLRKEEGYYAEEAQAADWKACRNCGKRYSKPALKKHQPRCERIGGASQDAQAELRLARAEATEGNLRGLFSFFDVDDDGSLSPFELGDLLRQCFPNRVADANELESHFHLGECV